MNPKRTQRLHNRESFFKYLPASTAKLVLKNQTLRWSSPILFNDPFDVPRELSFGLQPREMAEACARQMAAFIENPPADTTQLQPKLQLIAEGLKRGISNELRADLLQGIRETVESMQPSGAPMEEMRALWRSWLPDFRILCLTESPAHVAMWMHYAARYTGAVLEFRCMDELDSPWLIARPVQYTEEPPEVYTADGWAKIMSLEHERAVKTVFDIAAFTKSTDWSYEREWRITTFKRPTDSGDFTDYPFHVPELSAVYLGPLMSEDDKNELLQHIANYPTARVIDVSIGMSRELVFRESDRPPPARKRRYADAAGNDIPEIRRTPLRTEELERYTSDDDFNGVSVDLLRETASYMCIAYSLLPASTRKWSRDQAIVGGNMVRLYKLSSAMLDQTCQRRRMTAHIFGRLAFETIVNVHYLIEFASPELFESYVLHSLKHERRLYDRIQENVARRQGKVQPIELRMLTSIDRACRKSGVAIVDINASGPANWGGKNLFQKAEAVGLGYVYLGMFGGPSRNVHGGWNDLLEYHLDYEDDSEANFTPEPLWHRPRPQLLFTISRLTVPLLAKYFKFVTGGEGVFEAELQDLAERIDLADQAHERFLHDDSKP